MTKEAHDMPPRLPDNSRVKLRDGIGPEFYDGFGLPGNEGWIKKHDTDRYGPYRVFIEWDKDHWAYNGAQDGWTWEDHFDLAEESMTQTSKRDQLQSLMAAFTDSLLEVIEPDETGASTAEVPSPPEVGQEGASEQEEPSYEDILKSGLNASVDAESFFIIAIRKNEQEGVIYPAVYHASRTPAAALIAQLQLSNVASSFHGKLVAEALQAQGDDE